MPKKYNDVNYLTVVHLIDREPYKSKVLPAIIIV